MSILAPPPLSKTKGASACNSLFLLQQTNFGNFLQHHTKFFHRSYGFFLKIRKEGREAMSEIGLRLRYCCIFCGISRERSDIWMVTSGSGLEILYGKCFLSKFFLTQKENRRSRIARKRKKPILSVWLVKNLA